MATQTPNYGLTKPAGTEVPDIAVLNGNMDKIDAQMKASADNIGLLDVNRSLTFSWNSPSETWQTQLQARWQELPGNTAVNVHISGHGGNVTVVGSRHTSATNAGFMAWGYGQTPTYCKLLNDVWTFTTL